MKELVFVGLGLNDEKGISVKGLEEAKTADHVFMETYTSLMPDFSLERFEALCGKKIQVVSRRDLEEENGTQILKAAKAGKAVFLVPDSQCAILAGKPAKVKYGVGRID